MLHLRDVLGCMGKLERDAFAVPACGEAPALYDRNLVWHVGVDWIVRDCVDPRLRHVRAVAAGAIVGIGHGPRGGAQTSRPDGGTFRRGTSRHLLAKTPPEI